MDRSHYPRVKAFVHGVIAALLLAAAAVGLTPDSGAPAAQSAQR